MRKVRYISRILLSSFRRKLLLIWVITVLVSFGLSMSIGIAQSQLSLQSYYLNEDMRALAFVSDAETGYYTDENQRAASTQRVRARIEQWPGLLAVYEQTTVSVPDEGWSLLGYPAELLNRLHLPTAQANEELHSTAIENPIWLDSRLRSSYEIGDTLSLRLSSGKASTACAFTVAGFLNKENIHYDFQSSPSAETSSADFLVRNPSEIVCVTISDAMLAENAFDSSRSSAKFLLAESDEAISVWKKLARQQGIGYVSRMADILENDRKNIDLMTTPILALCAVMGVLTVIGLIGTQLQLMNLYKQVAFSLAMTGMEWRTWKAAWLTILCLPLWIASLLGAALGNAWKSVLMLEHLRILSPTVLAVSAAMVLLSITGILPTIGRWSQININEFRRLSE